MNTRVKFLASLAGGIRLMGVASTAAYAAGRIDTSFDVANFSANSAVIDNPYMPLPARTTFVYRTMAKDGCEVNPVEVTDVTPVIDGITCRQVHDQVYEDDNCDGSRNFLSEDTLDWYAEDKEGNVWYFGEDTKEFCDPDHPNVVCSTAGSFLAGVNGAAPGIIMLAQPAPGDFYQQESAEDALDMAKVMRLNARVTLTFENQIDPDEYTGCLETKEWSPLETGAIEHKYYCLGIGLLLNTELQSGTARTELVDIAQQ
jgi:hypothetical protein